MSDISTQIKSLITGLQGLLDSLDALDTQKTGLETQQRDFNKRVTSFEEERRSLLSQKEEFESKIAQLQSREKEVTVKEQNLGRVLSMRDQIKEQAQANEKRTKELAEISTHLQQEKQDFLTATEMQKKKDEEERIADRERKHLLDLREQKIRDKMRLLQLDDSINVG